LKKILVVAGVIILCALILSTWFFIGNLGNFSKFLGKESTNIFVDEKSRFIGNWGSTDEISHFTFKSDGSFISNYIQGAYEINKNNMILLNYNPDTYFNSSSYKYEFSIDDMMLTFYDVDTLEVTFVLKKIQLVS